ncbi:MAG TPA: NAD-binding protein [Mycobacterium sp.]|nr:NAD-binding protein [Mycobacterium sp.]
MSFRRRVGRYLSDYRWLILAVAGLVAFALGFVGWWQALRSQLGHNPNVTDAAYWSLNNFFVNSPAQVNVPWALDIARFLAPAVAGWAGLSALGSLFRDRVQQMRIPMMRDHVVICGLGAYAGNVFVRHLHDERIDVVVIELDANNPSVELCRSLGIPVIIGDAQRQRTLQAAGAHHASRVLAITPEDAVNTQIVATVRELTVHRSRQLRCLALITNPEFCRLLRVQEAQRGDPELSIDFFNIDEISARLMLEDFPIDVSHGQPHIVVAHLDPLGVWLIYHAARAWYEKRGDSREPLVVTIFDHQPTDRVEALLGQHPALEKACKFVTFFATARDISHLPEHHRSADTPPISRAYVTSYRDANAFETALQLRHELDPTIPVVAALSRLHGVAGLLDDVKEAGALSNIDVFASMERSCTAELVRGGSFEPMAQAIHERWRQEAIAKGEPAPTWQDLDESRKESSRDQARHIPIHLRKVDCAIAPLRDWEAKDFTFTDSEIKLLAIAEHERWTRERVADGWTLAVEKNVERKETPYLLPWEQLKKLYPDAAELDPVSIRAVPAILASAGLQIIRTPAE